MHPTVSSQEDGEGTTTLCEVCQFVMKVAEGLLENNMTEVSPGGRKRAARCLGTFPSACFLPAGAAGERHREGVLHAAPQRHRPVQGLCGFLWQSRGHHAAGGH